MPDNLKPCPFCGGGGPAYPRDGVSERRPLPGRLSKLRRDDVAAHHWRQASDCRLEQEG